ncbi:MAG: hypothetical protein KBT39_03060 [Bacteroidales bacterium]|nr:hypothetical protein [Bacteroidales bacterium]
MRNMYASFLIMGAKIRLFGQTDKIMLKKYEKRAVDGDGLETFTYL